MKICFLSSGLEERNQFVQPWRYLLQGAYALDQSGHQVYFLSDGHAPIKGEFAGYQVKRITSLQEWPLHENKHLVRFLSEERPDLILWHLGLTSFLRLSTSQHISAPLIGVFTSPIYCLSDLLRLGILRLFRNHGLSSVHLLGSLVPSQAIQRVLKQGPIRKLVVESNTTQAQLQQRGIPEKSLEVIKPYISPIWFQEKPTLSERLQVREEYGLSPDHFVVGFLGAPAPLRGLPALIQAGKLAIKKNPKIRLLILSRVINKKNRLDNLSALRMIKDYQLGQQVRIVPGLLSQEQLIRSIAICDAIVLPFELVPSDVPLSIIETMALGIPLITSNVACIPEMVPEGTGILVPLRDVKLLSEAILSLSTDAQLRENLSGRGREQALSWQSINESQRAWNNLVLSYAARS